MNIIFETVSLDIPAIVYDFRFEVEFYRLRKYLQDCIILKSLELLDELLYNDIEQMFVQVTLYMWLEL